jgi:acyl dehydratase
MTPEDAAPPPLRFEQLRVGDRLPPWTRTTDIMSWNRFAAVNDEFLYFHMDDDAGRAALNAQGAFGMGNLRFAYLGNALHAAFGDGAVVHELSCQFRSINQKGDVLTVVGTVVEKREDGAARGVRIELDVVNGAGESTCPAVAEMSFPAADE